MSIVTSDQSRMERVTGAADSATRSQFKQRLWLICAMVLGIGAIGTTLFFQMETLMLGFAGILLAVLLYVPSDWLSRKLHFPYLLCLAMVCLLLTVLLLGAMWLVGWRLADQMTSLEQQLPIAIHHATDLLNNYRWGRWLVQHTDRYIANSRQDLFATLARTAPSAASIIFQVFAVIFLGLFLAINPQLYVRNAVRLAPLRYRPKVRELMLASRGLLWWWLIAQFCAMVFIGVVTAGTDYMLGVQLALTLGILAAFLNFIPNFGPILAVVPAALLGLLHSPMTAVWVAIAYTLIQLFQNHVVTPLIQREAVRLPPVVLLAAQVFMFYWAGGLAMALAPPLSALALLLVRRLYLRDTLGDPLKDNRGFWPDGAEPQPSANGTANGTGSG